MQQKPPELALPRKQPYQLIAAYHRRFYLEDTTQEYTQGRETSLTHLIHFQKHSNFARKSKRNLPYYVLIDKLFEPKYLETFAKFAKETYYFGKSPCNLPVKDPKS